MTIPIQYTPQVGDLLILDGITRRITNVQRGAVEFDHPDRESEVIRRALMQAWKDRRAAFAEAARAAEATRLGEPTTELERRGLSAHLAGVHAAAIEQYQHGTPDSPPVEWPPEKSRKGVVGAEWLYWMDGLNCWAVQGRIEGRSPKSGATVLDPAVAATVGVVPTTEG